MSKLKLGIIVGSNRKESINRKLAQALAKLGADAFDATFIQIDDLPMYNQDHENPVPAPVARFKAAVEGAQALLFVTPEHNRSMPALLKNAIDWGTRPWGKSSWPGKPAAIIGTSGGAVSTAVAQQHLRAVLAGLPDMPLRRVRTTRSMHETSRPSSTNSPPSPASSPQRSMPTGGQ